jgi:polysaccharide deacetylase 2 family uncharacterized protein YibQ
MPGKKTWAGISLLALAIAFGAGWYFRSRVPKTAPQAAISTPEASNPEPSFEAHLRDLLPSLGLRPEKLSREGNSGPWNLKLPRRRKLQAFGEALRKSLTSRGLMPSRFELRENNLLLEVGSESLNIMQDSGPALAIVIDDWGYNTLLVPQMAAFPATLTIAVMPGLPRGADCAQAAAKAGHEVILHQPMETLKPMPLAPGTIKASMSDAEILALLDSHFQALPQMSGLNNHEGSKGSADPRLMRLICGWLKQKGLYFLDSKTSAASVGEAEARQAGIPYAARRVFLDNEDKVEAVEKALSQAAAIALKTGSCIAIGHPRKNTFAALENMVRGIQAKGLSMVPVSELTLFEIAGQ